MPAASFVQSTFIGGEVSKSVQGQLDNPAYRSWLQVCLNSLPMEQHAWTRRPGTMHLGLTRGGAPGRVIDFDFKQSQPYTMEFTAGFLRFRAGPQIVYTNDQQTITGVSATNPAEITTFSAHGFATGNQVVFPPIGTTSPLLLNRQFAITVTGPSKFTIADAVTGATIDGATLAGGAGLVSRIYEIATPYTGTLWQSLRSIQADIPLASGTTPGAVLLQPTIKPYVLQVVTIPTPTAFATFAFAPANFKDGPYLDPVPGGTLATPSGLIGIIGLALSFNAWDATVAYPTGAYVTNGGNNYKSLVDANLNSAPPSANWVAVSSSDAIGPNGFTGADVGRMVRLFSEPPLWVVGGTYVAGTSIVAYAGVYWKCLSNNTGATTNTPNTSPTIWALFPTGAIWTWGKITGLTNVIDRALAGSTSIGDMTGGGGLAAVFNGIISQIASACAERTVTSGGLGPNQSLTVISYVGKNYSLASAQKIQQAVVYPSSDAGLAFGTYGSTPFVPVITVNLRAKATAPANSADGTLLGTSGTIGNTTSPVTIISTDQVTTWNYVWVEVIATGTVGPGGGITPNMTNAIGELSFFNPAGTGVSAGVNVQITGDALLYTTPIRVWRLGLYGDAQGWPSCGTWHEGRLWLSGVVGNRIDSSRSNDPFNFAPTNPDGTVPANAGISYVFNAPDVNPIFWMEPDDHGIVCGTQAGEWVVQATNANLPLSPTTIQAHRYTKYNCANVLPARTNLTLMAVQAFRRELLEYFADVYSGRFGAHDLVENSKHLVASGIQEIGYQQELIPIIWARMADGSLAGWTYSRQSLVSSQPPSAYGAHRHVLGSGRTVESITVGGNSDGTLDSLVMVTNDAATGLRHVEMLANVFLETDLPANAWVLDDAVRPSSTSTTSAPTGPAPYGGLTINGLWHLNGKTVQVFAAGLDCGDPGEGNPIVDFLVTNGSVFVPYGDSVSAGSGAGLFTAAFAATALAANQVVVGFTYTSDGQIVRPNSPQESGARNGPGFGKLRRNHFYALLVNQTAGLSIGTRFGVLDKVDFNPQGSGAPLPMGQTFSGVYRAAIRDDDSYEGAICWRVSRPYPATICTVGGFLETKDA